MKLIGLLLVLSINDHNNTKIYKKKYLNFWSSYKITNFQCNQDSLFKFSASVINRKDYERKKHLIVDHYMPDKLLDKIKDTIGNKKFDDTKILIETDHNFLDNIIMKNVVILITCVMKDLDKFYSVHFIGKTLVTEQ